MLFYTCEKTCGVFLGLVNLMPGIFMEEKKQRGKLMEITNEMIASSYKLAKKVYETQISKQDAVKELSTEYGMNKGSATDYIMIYKCMREGKVYKRAMSQAGTEHFLNHIYQDNGKLALRNALRSVGEHLKYYESLENGKLNGIRKIYAEYSKLLDNDLTYPEEEENIYKEGKAQQVYVNKYERDRNARKKCIEYYGYECFVCGILLEDKYGDIGKDFIHVHHIKELSTIKEEYTVDPINDLRPLCPNCHAMIHRKVPAYSIEELKELIKNK